MEQSQMLTQLIVRAIENGWEGMNEYPFSLGTWSVKNGLFDTTIEVNHPIGDGHTIYSSTGLLFGDNLSFLRALFGEETVDGYGIRHITLGLRFKQWAFEYLGAIHAVPEGQRYFQVIEVGTPRLSEYLDTDKIDPVEVDRVEIRLQDLFAQVPFSTHKLEDIDAYGLTPRFQHVAEIVVTLPDTERIPWLHDRVFGEEEDDCYYDRTCEHCGHQWEGLHSPEDGYQNPCPDCGVRPTPVKEKE